MKKITSAYITLSAFIALSSLAHSMGGPLERQDSNGTESWQSECMSGMCRSALGSPAFEDFCSVRRQSSERDEANPLAYVTDADLFALMESMGLMVNGTFVPPCPAVHSGGGDVAQYSAEFDASFMPLEFAGSEANQGSMNTEPDVPADVDNGFNFLLFSEGASFPSEDPIFAGTLPDQNATEEDATGTSNPVHPLHYHFSHAWQ